MGGSSFCLTDLLQGCTPWHCSLQGGSYSCAPDAPVLYTHTRISMQTGDADIFTASLDAPSCCFTALWKHDLAVNQPYHYDRTEKVASRTTNSLLNIRNTKVKYVKWDENWHLFPHRQLLKCLLSLLHHTFSCWCCCFLGFHKNHPNWVKPCL